MRPRTASMEADSKVLRNFSNTFTHTTMLAALVSSSMVINITPLAEPGR